MSRLLASFGDRLPALQAREPGWLACLRERAARRVEMTGLPHKKLEAWRVTPIAPLDALSFVPARRDPQATPATLTWLEQHLGRPVGARAVAVAGAPVVVPHAAGVWRLRDHLDHPDVRAHLGQHAPAEYFAALGTALFDDGMVLCLNADHAVVEVVHVGTRVGEHPTVSYPRLLIVVAEGVQATVVESYVTYGASHGAGDVAEELCAPVTEVVLGRGARLEHVRATEGAKCSFHLATLAVHQERESVYESRVITLGGALSRVEVHVDLAGEGAECSLGGAYHSTGKELVDHHTYIDHAAPRCASREDYRGVVDGKSRAVFDGTIVVRRDSQGTRAHQGNRNLLLSDSATVNTKPHLEIEADDVMCSHGATIGALDPEQLFYAESRGISPEQATAMLTYAFVRAVLDAITCEPVRARLSRAVAARLPHGRTIQEMMS